MDVPDRSVLLWLGRHTFAVYPQPCAQALYLLSLFPLQKIMAGNTVLMIGLLKRNTWSFVVIFSVSQLAGLS